MGVFRPCAIAIYYQMVRLNDAALSQMREGDRLYDLVTPGFYAARGKRTVRSAG
jgi:hypothetical protein